MRNNNFRVRLQLLYVDALGVHLQSPASPPSVNLLSRVAPVCLRDALSTPCDLLSLSTLLMELQYPNEILSFLARGQLDLQDR